VLVWLLILLTDTLLFNVCSEFAVPLNLLDFIACTRSSKYSLFFGFANIVVLARLLIRLLAVVVISMINSFSRWSFR
jgi:hypothetical protein